MRIAEIYKSIQGEGRLTGVESVFVRTSGCNLRCWFCDTPYASWNPEGDDLSIEAILEKTLELDCRHVVITGGEPMLFAELIPLCERLGREQRHITIETAGTLDLPVVCDLMSVSPKFASSAPPPDSANQWRLRHEQTRRAPQVIERILSDYDHQFKFVVDSTEDCDAVLQYLDEFPDLKRDHVWIMPQGVDVDELARKQTWLAAWCEEQKLHYCPRKQVEWFGGMVRGV